MGTRLVTKLGRILPLADWLADYGKADFRDDLIAGVVVTFITIPQVIAYAFLAGLPAELGLYSAIVALLFYTLLGSSRTLAVGPTAIIAMMTLETVSSMHAPGSPEYAATAVKLALVTGMVLVGLRLVNFGALVSFLSHAVITGFISAAACLIIVNQLPGVLGLGSVDATRTDLILQTVLEDLSLVNLTAVAISLGTIVLLWFCKGPLARILRGKGSSSQTINIVTRSAPMYAVIIGIMLAAGLGLEVDVVGAIPTSLPAIALVEFTLVEFVYLLPPSFFIALIVFMESTSIGSAVAGKRRERIDPNQELIGLGGANIAAGLVGGFPVAGSFARTMVNFSAGASTPLASLITALCVLIALLWLTPLFYYLPKGILSAIIIVSAVQLIDIGAIKKIFRFNTSDSVTFLVTAIAVLATGVETGILIGILISFCMLIQRSSKPHIAEVGRVGESEHFRNVLRYEVKTSPKVLAFRVDESLYFVNIRYIETYLLNRIAESPETDHILLICSAANFIDTSGLEMLENLSHNLEEAGVTLHLSEVKGPVMDRLKDTDFYAQMKGKVFFTTDLAMKELGGI